MCYIVLDEHNGFLIGSKNFRPFHNEVLYPFIFYLNFNSSPHFGLSYEFSVHYLYFTKETN